MKAKHALAALAIIAIAAVGYNWASNRETGGPPTMNPAGESTDNGWVVKRKKVDYEAVIRTALVQQASLLTFTATYDVVRDQRLKDSIKYLPLPSSHARVRVKYRVEFPIGYVLAPGQFSISERPDGLVLTLRRPQLISKPSVELQSWTILERGILIDEKVAVIELQQRIQPDQKKRAVEAVNRPDAIPRSEKALRGFLQPILAQHAEGEPVPQIRFVYR